MNTDRNKNCISIVIKRADFETKTPDYPGFDHIYDDESTFSLSAVFQYIPESDDTLNV